MWSQLKLRFKRWLWWRKLRREYESGTNLVWHGPCHVYIPPGSRLTCEQNNEVVGTVGDVNEDGIATIEFVWNEEEKGE